MKQLLLISLMMLLGFGCTPDTVSVEQDHQPENTISSEYFDPESIPDDNSETMNIVENRPPINVPDGEVNSDMKVNDPLIAYLDRKSIMTDTQISGEQTVSFSKVYEGSVDQANIWLFPVPDSDGRMILSTERSNELYMAELTVDDPSARVSWKQVVSSSDIDGNKIADHWHVFAHGYHWITFSITSANGAYLAKIDKDLDLIALERIVENPTFPTNDMFLVAQPDGVGAAFFLPGYGHRVLRFDTDLNEIGSVDIGGGQSIHGNGSSAILTDDGIHVLAADQMNVVSQGGVRLLKYDFDWNLVEVVDLVDFDNTNIGMVSGNYLDDGSLVMVARVNLEAFKRGENPPPTGQIPGGALADDGGYIGRYLFDSLLKLAGVEYLFEQGNTAHRPHQSILGGRLYSAWDLRGSTTLRIDEIQY
jgi:hypothetical protein